MCLPEKLKKKKKKNSIYLLLNRQIILRLYTLFANSGDTFGMLCYI